MTIGIDGRLWNQTGVGRYIRNLVSNLEEIDTKNNYVLFLRAEDVNGVSLKSPRWKLVTSDVQWHSFKEQIEFPNTLNKENLDLVHFPYFSVPILYKRPFVVTIHDLIMHHHPTGKASTLPTAFYKAKRIGYQKVLNNAIKKSKKIIVPLNCIKDDLIKSLNVPSEKITVTYEGVDRNLKIENLKLENQKYGKYFMYVGNAYPHKNLEKLIEAFKIFQKNGNENVKLILVGKNDFFYKRLEIQTKDPSIIFLHDISDSELASLYSDAVALVSASLMEGFGLPAIEAIANNCIVILSDIPSFREVCGDGAIYFNSQNPNELALKMEEVYISEKKKYNHLMSVAQDRLKFFSWSQMAEKTLEIYTSI